MLALAPFAAAPPGIATSATGGPSLGVGRGNRTESRPLQMWLLQWSVFRPIVASVREKPYGIGTPTLVMGAVWDVSAAEWGPKWPVWHPTLVMGAVWDVLPKVLSAKWPIWHPTFVLCKFGLCRGRFSVRIIPPTIPAPFRPGRNRTEYRPRKSPNCTGRIFVRISSGSGRGDNPPAR